MDSVLLSQIFVSLGFFIVFVACLVITKTMGSLGIMLLRIEYLIAREYELVLDKERIKAKIFAQQKKDESAKIEREKQLDPLQNIPYSIRK